MDRFNDTSYQEFDEAFYDQNYDSIVVELMQDGYSAYEAEDLGLDMLADKWREQILEKRGVQPKLW